MGTKIEYVEETVNFITGCTKLSLGCQNCYAEKMTLRLKRMRQKKYQEGFDNVVEHWSMLSTKLRKKGTRYFVNSMSDTFHQKVSYEFLCEMFEQFISYPQHTFIIVTKRAERASQMIGFIWHHLQRVHPELEFPLKNVQLVVTAENQEMYKKRVPYLLGANVAVRGLSIEPMLGPIDISGEALRLDWVVVGGESTAKARPMRQGWAELIRDQCKDAGTAFFFKQMSGKTKAERENIPQGLQIREYPSAK